MRTLPVFLVLILCWYQAAAQRKITGKITEPGSDYGLAGIVVKVKGSSVGTVTDIYGAYELEVPKNGKTLVISGPGFETIEITINSRSVIDSPLRRQSEIENTELSIGFGAQSKAELTSSLTQVKSSDFEGSPVIDLEQAYQGRASGVFIQNNGGGLGEGATVRIRGNSTISGNNEPLYVVDGIPLTSGSQSDINPSTIESIEVLKDAAATALYGSRASSGVVLITTKKGKEGRLKIDFDYQFGIGETPERLDLYSPLQYNAQTLEFGLRDNLPELQSLELVFLLGGNLTRADEVRETIDQIESALNEGSAANYAQWVEDRAITLSDGSSISLFGAQSTSFDSVFTLIGRQIDSLSFDTDWQDEVFRTAASHRVNLNLSGGTDKLNFFSGFSFTDQEGIVIGNEFQRFNARLNVAGEITPRLSADVSVNYTYSRDDRLNDNQDLGFPLQAILLPPSDGFDPANNFQLNVRTLDYNPLTEINFADNVAFTNSVIGNLGLSYELSDLISLNMEGALDFSDISVERRQGPETLEGQGTGFSRLTENQFTNTLYNAYLDYNNSIGSNQRISAIFGASYQLSTIESSFRSANVNSISTLESLNTDNPPIADSKSAFLSFYSRISYSIKDTYFFELSARADGSSRFSEDNRFGIFPAISAAWDITKEDFLTDNILSTLKLRASFGLTGNTPDDDFAYRNNFSVVGYGNETGIRLDNLSNRDIKWETTEQTDIGLEIGVLNDRFTATVDYYLKNTRDLILPDNITLTSGFPEIIENVGRLRNTGIELSLNSQNISKGDFQWSTGFNISFNDNTITELLDPIIVGQSAFIQDQPGGVIFTRRFVGVNPDNGRALYDDGNGGTTENFEAAPNLVVGDPNPDFFGGISNNLSYKNFELDFLFQFVQGVDIYNQGNEFLANSGILNLSQSVDQVNRWYRPGDISSVPGLDPFQENTFPSSRFVEDGSYLRLKNVNFTYSFSQDLVAKWGINYLKIYVGAQNLFTVTKFSGYDPDVNYVDPNSNTIERNLSRGISNFTIPQARTYITGIKIGL